MLGRIEQFRWVATLLLIEEALGIEVANSLSEQLSSLLSTYY